MDIKKIEKLIKLVDDSQISELEIGEGENVIRIAKTANQVVQVAQAPMPVQQVAAPQAQPAPNIPSDSMPKTQKEPESDLSGGEIVRSPMVGTFYRSPAPGSDMFVSEGKKVNPGDTLCIIEAMKIMNQIESETSGEVKKILVEDGSPVEYDQPLFIIG
ncbi:acetyl-CoA carboxylase biotin carboxyl carrier protein [Thiotrichales bacterium 19X7-9]|nr:acetyl-CoA carboxylase biotin carboxyl carrier protein [Thiotrichales bacterium 19X7-9]TNF65272.1 MAG: acetyl-CoA carboxylase biotin carboxyl carrier protein [Gammaproteobacteria bacterium]UTW41628.1 acetyl-CoA carboxylase biotin carboxyl carrier protein [bacterium SCSIO 12844]